MKFTWKVFVLMMLVTVAALSWTSYSLTNSAFETALAQQEQKALDQARALCSLVERMTAGHAFSAGDGELAAVMEAAAGDVAGARLYRGDGTQIYPREAGAADAELLAAAQAGPSHRIDREGESYLMRTLAPVQLGETTGFVATVSDVSPPFALAVGLLRQARLVTLIALGAAGALILALCAYLTRPIRILSAATRDFSRGNYARRAAVASRDEIGALACDFNRMADSLEEHMRHLEEEARRREDFVTSFAHELKTPLTCIIGYADMLRSRPLDEEGRFRCADYIFTEGRRLERLSLKLLELMVLHRQEFELAALDTRVIRERLTEAAGALAKKYGAALSCDLAPARVLAEPDLLQTLLLNLADNAAKAYLPGENPPERPVRVIGRRCPAGYRVDVADEGRGIPREALSRVTEAFYTADKSRSREYSGVGLGLALCAAIAAVHGARLELESKPGRGTTAWLLLPYAPEPAEDA